MDYRNGEAQERATGGLCEALANYVSAFRAHDRGAKPVEGARDDGGSAPIRVVELFAGVGGFRVGLERASECYKTVWSNQWEPATKRQDASAIYCKHYGQQGHTNADITSIAASAVPESDLLCAGFPCQDYSVATTLRHAGGLEGQKGALWWQIYRILQEKGDSRPNYLMFENVDRLINSPAQQRGRDFAVILGSLAQLGYIVEWRVINAASYGMPQRRSRVYMVGYHSSTRLAAQCEAVGDWYEWALRRGVLAAAFACEAKDDARVSFSVRGAEENSPGALAAGGARSPFRNAGVMVHGEVRTLAVAPCYEGPRVLLGDLLVPDGAVPASFYIDAADVPKWEYAKGGKSFQRINRTTGFAYRYSEGAMAFPDDVGRPSRTVVTGEGGAGPSRFKHVVRCEDGRLRRLVPLELERLNMFPDDYTAGASDGRRAFLMGNALVTGVVERIGVELARRIETGGKKVGSKQGAGSRFCRGPMWRPELFGCEHVGCPLQSRFTAHFFPSPRGGEA